MPSTPVRHIVARSNAPYIATLQVVTIAGVPFPLPNYLPPGVDRVLNDLSMVPGLRTGDEFNIRLMTNIGAVTTAPRVLTFNVNTPMAAWITASGTATVPIITFNDVRNSSEE